MLGYFFSEDPLMHKYTGKRETPFDQGYDAGLVWGDNIDPDKQLITKVSRGTKSQYLAGLKLGQQEARKRKLQQLVLMDLS